MSTVKWPRPFAPSFTPEEMLKKGVFEGKYINAVNGLPASWYRHDKVLSKKEDPDPKVNFYGVKSRQPLSVWKENGWIKSDPSGWFEWYCHFFLGRRLGEEDDWQIQRWRSFVARHSAQVQSKCEPGDRECHTKQRQALLQWAWDSDKPFTPEQCERNLKRLNNLRGISLESLTPRTSFW